MHIVRHPAFRWALSAVLLSLMFYQLWNRSNHFQSFSFESWKLAGWHILLVALLMPLNWWLETAKWMKFLSVHTRISFTQAYRAVISGIALSLFTPNRIGEYGGRIMFMPHAYRWPVVFSTLVGSLSQNLIAFSMGVISFCILFQDNYYLKLAGIILMTLASLSFFNIYKVVKWISRWNLHHYLRKLQHQTDLLQNYNLSLLANSLILSFARYSVYTFQFAFLLTGFEPQADLLKVILGVSCLYLFHTVVPMPPVADVLARTNLALILWSGAGMNELSISMASFIVWVINLLVPAIMGSLVIGTIKPEKAFNTHDPDLSPAYEPVIADRSADKG